MCATSCGGTPLAQPNFRLAASVNITCAGYDTTRARIAHQLPRRSEVRVSWCDFGARLSFTARKEMATA